MERYLGEEKITQTVYGRNVSGSQVQILEYDASEGYQYSLKKSYMCEVAEYFADVKEGKERDIQDWGKRIAIVAPNVYVARQAYLTLLRGIAEEKKRLQKPDGYDYDMVLGRQWNDGRIDLGEVTAIPCEQAAPQILSETSMLLPLHICDNRKEYMYEYENARAILLEYGAVMDGDRLAEEVLSRQNDFVAVFIKPVGSYEYVLRRLSFEGDYKVLRIGSPTQQDYLEYAQDYIASLGFVMDEKVNLQECLEKLRRYRGSLLIEQDIYRHLFRCMTAAKQNGRKHLLAEDMQRSYYGEAMPGKDYFAGVIGLDLVKEAVERMLAAEKVMCGFANKMYRHMIFAGAPGTGKSMMARMLAERMGEMGLSNGRFVDVCRADVIGKYVGHTAHNVCEIFQRAEGGVLFVDEAAFLLENDVFVKEAVIEFVRFMELCPQTMVIFAGYPAEMEMLKNCDSGFASRIKRTILFEDYEEAQLFEILEQMAGKYHFTIQSESQKAVYSYIRQIQGRKGYGNAREMRKLLEIAIEEYGLQAAEGAPRELSKEHIIGAVDRLLTRDRKENGFGFRAMKVCS